jgi:opacity protein-like surface antigen
MNKSLLAAGGLFLALAAMPAAAQNWSRFSFHAGGGFTKPVRSTENRVDMGFNLGAGAGVYLTKHVGVNVDFGYNELNLSQRVLETAGVPGGSGRLYSVTLNPIIRFNPEGRFDPYITFGGGFYRRTVEFTEPTISVVTGFDPFYGFFPVAIPANQVLGSFSQNKGGWNGGAGFAVRVFGDSRAKLFAEARFHQVYTSPVRTSLIPVTFGIRW